LIPGHITSMLQGRRVWRGADLSDEAEWCFALAPDTLAELDAFLADDRAATPCLERDARIIREELSIGRGFVVIRGLPIDRYTDEQAGALYTAICQHVGVLLPQTLNGDTLYSVRDEGLTLDRDYGRAGVRTSKTRGAFQFHTDSPSRLAGHIPDYIGLLVLRTAKSGGETALVSGYEAHNLLAAAWPDLLHRLYLPYWVDRRAELPPGEDPVLPTPVFAREGARLIVRYLRFYITKGQEWKGVPLTPADVEPLDALDDIMNGSGVALTIVPRPGDIQLVNNTFVLHSRTAYEDFSDPALKRHYLRIWLAAADGQLANGNSQ
jgi:hypothetical protein